MSIREKNLGAQAPPLPSSPPPPPLTPPPPPPSPPAPPPSPPSTASAQNCSTPANRGAFARDRPLTWAPVRNDRDFQRKNFNFWQKWRRQMRKESNSEKVSLKAVKDGEIASLASPFSPFCYNHVASWLKDSTELEEASNCLIHNNLCCPRYQIGLRFHNFGSIILLNCTAVRGIRYMQEFFTKMAVIYLTTILSHQSTPPIPAHIFKPQDLESDVTVHLHSKDLDRINEFALWFAACIQRSPYCDIIRPKIGEPFHTSGIMHAPMFCTWDMLNVSPMSLVKEKKNDDCPIVEPAGRWITRRMKCLTLYKCDRPIAEYDFSNL